MFMVDEKQKCPGWLPYRKKLVNLFCEWSPNKVQLFNAEALKLGHELQIGFALVSLVAGMLQNGVVSLLSACLLLKPNVCVMTTRR